MLDNHKLTGRLFKIIPFDFRFSKEITTIIMAIPLVPIALLFSPVTFGIFFLSILILNIEYNRVDSIRQKIMVDCIWSQLVFEDEISSGMKQLPDANPYIDQTDIDCIFGDAIYDHIQDHKKTSNFKLNSMLNKIKNMFSN